MRSSAQCLAASTRPFFTTATARRSSPPRTTGSTGDGWLLRSPWWINRPYLVASDVGTAAALFTSLESPASLTGAVVGHGGAAVPVELGSRNTTPMEVPDVQHADHRWRHRLNTARRLDQRDLAR